ncbi:MAG TPA: FimV/HubP family polar landmark protein, partial [Gammaproteobacteria bacterium]|nr:FimV/HubP family polar landmark protein [Gammaproteobacteria bacterium]
TREATERLRSRIRIEDEPIVVEEQHTRELPEAAQSAEVFFDPGVGELEDVDEDDELLPVADLDDDTVDIAATSKPAPEAKASKPATETTMSSQTVINLDQADPIAEADFHMAYGLYDQAADLVSKALETDADNRALRLKLLEVYFVWGNREAFLDTARILRASIGSKPDSDWDKVVIMGKQICPEESLFAEASAPAESVDLDLAAGDSPALDLAFEDQSGLAMDLDLGGDEDATLELTGSDDDSDVLDIGDGFDIGAATAAGLESAFLEPSPDASAKTSPNLDIDSETQEAPTLEALGPNAPTMESPVLDASSDDSAELPTLRQPGLAMDDVEPAEQTAEIDLDDLGLNVDELNELAIEPSGNRSVLDVDDEDADVLSATGVTQVLSVGDEPEGRGKGRGDDAVFARTEVLQPRQSSADDDRGATGGLAGDADEDFGLDIDLDELSAALDGGDTVEQPSVGGFGNRSRGGLDLDVGLDPLGSDEPTATEQVEPLDAQTLTEVGTKLDLARAYIDMGDPEGARSILEEVLDEGDSSQKREAQGLIEAL